MLPAMSDPQWLPRDLLLLDDRCPLPLDAPFTSDQASALGVSPTLQRRLLSAGLIRRVVQGVHAVSQLPDDFAVRCAALHLVVPESAIVTDRTAAWLHGVDIQPRSARYVAPPVSIFSASGSRLRRPGIASGVRGLTDRDVVVVDGIRVTSPLRTACDLGRLLWRYDALAALDGFLRAGLDHDELLAELPRFKGYRRVIQLRTLAPLADGRAEAPSESALRLHWYEAGLPPPELQWWVYTESGIALYRLDLALPEVKYAAEYDGEDFHTADEDREHDDERRGWLREERQWTLDVFVKDDVYSRTADPGPRLRHGLAQARQSMSLWTPYTRRK
jgi:hypothetical protein